MLNDLLGFTQDAHLLNQNLLFNKLCTSRSMPRWFAQREAVVMTMRMGGHLS